MSTVNVSRPKALKEFVDEHVGGGGYGSSSERARKLIHEDQDCQRLRGMLLDGVASPPTGAVNAGHLDRLRRRIRDFRTR